MADRSADQDDETRSTSSAKRDSTQGAEPEAPQPEDPSAQPLALATPPERYSFSRFTRDSWAHFRGAAASLIALFCAIHVVAALLPYLIVFDVPDAAGYPLVFLFRVVLPVLLGTVAMAVGSILLLRRSDVDAPLAVEGFRKAWREVAQRAPDVAVMGLVASLFAIVAVLFLGAYGFLILHFFYGPPVAIQALLAKRGSYGDALQQSRALLQGNWRTILYLLNAALAIGAVGLLVLDLIVRLVGTGGGPVLAVIQGLVLGTLTASLAGAQVSIFLYLQRRREPHPGHVEHEDELVSEEAAGPNQD